MGVVLRKRSAKYDVREGIMYIPDPLAPSGFREYLTTQKAKERRRMALAERAGNRCQFKGCWAPYPQGDMCHIRATGAGGDDSMDNTLWGCRQCHQRSHQPRAVPRKQ